jgi:hypothetical protein
MVCGAGRGQEQGAGGSLQAGERGEEAALDLDDGAARVVDAREGRADLATRKGVLDRDDRGVEAGDENKQAGEDHKTGKQVVELVADRRPALLALKVRNQPCQREACLWQPTGCAPCSRSQRSTCRRTG